MRIKPAVRNFLSEETGQTTVEYLLIIVLVVTVAMQMRKKMISFIAKLMKALDAGADEIISNPEDVS